MLKTNRKPSHPGLIFKSTVLEDKQLPVSEVAQAIGVSRPALSRFINGRARCSQEMARKLAAFTGTGVSMWLNLQLAVDIWEAEQEPLPKVLTAEELEVA